MRLIKENDLFELRVLSLISNEDLRVLHLLYQPFLGSVAVGIYQTLLYTSQLYEDGPSSHDFLFKQLAVTSLDFANAITKLEACELIKTYADRTNDFTYYYYELYSPKQAKDFFKDPVFSGLLTSYIGERRVQQVSSLFASGKAYNFKDKEVTTSFGEVYSPDLNADAFNQFIDSDYLGRNERKRKAPFNLALFKDILRETNHIIADSALSDEDLKRVIALTMVYSFNEQTMASQVAEAYDFSRPFGARVDFDYVTRNLKELARYKHIAKPKRIKPSNRLSSDSEKARLINRMEVESSLDFLASFNEGLSIPDSEVNLLIRLSNDYNLNNAVINALIYHVLMTQEMKLSPAYVEKIAVNLARLKFEHAVDVINHFEGQKDGWKTKKSRPSSNKKVNKTDEPVEQMDEEEYKKLLEELNNVK